MLLRGSAWAVAWLVFVLLFAAPTPQRLAWAVLGLIGAAAMRRFLGRRPLFVVGLATGLGAIAVLIATAPSTAATIRTVLGGVFGLLGLYCGYRALRG
jgi:hypothetical protein